MWASVSCWNMDRGKKNWHGRKQASAIRNTLGRVFPISVLSVFFLSFCFTLKEWQGQEGEGLIYDLQQSKSATSIVCQFHHWREHDKKPGKNQLTMNTERRIYFKVLSEILPKKSLTSCSLKWFFTGPKWNIYVPWLQKTQCLSITQWYKKRKKESPTSHPLL